MSLTSKAPGDPWAAAGKGVPLRASEPFPRSPRSGEAHSLPGWPPGWLRACGGGALGSADDGPGGRERFLQSLVSAAKGARRWPRERSSVGASGSLLPAGSGKADAVWSNTRQTATTSHNFILESRPAAAPARAGGGEENRTMQVRLRRLGP